MQLLHIVGADEESPSIVATKPLTVSTIDSNTADTDSRQQIVGIVCTIVARNLHLIECHTTLPYFTLLNHKRPHIGTHPDIAFFVFTDAGDPVDVITGTILIDKVIVFHDDVILHITAEDCRLYPVVIDEPQQPTTVYDQTAEGVLADAVAVGQNGIMMISPFVGYRVKLQ